MIKKLFSHTAIYGLAPQVSKIAYFFALPFITEHLTDIDFGIAGIMTAYTTAISVFSMLGLNLILLNTYYKSPAQYKWGWRQIYGFLTLWNFFYALILFILLYNIIPDEAYPNRWIIIILNLGPLIFFGQTTAIGTMYYRVRQKPMEIGVRTAASGLLNVLLSVYFIVNLKMGYMGWFWATFISGICINFSYWYPLNIIYKITPIFNFKWRYIRNSLKITLPTIPHYYSSYLLSNSDKMVMDVLNVNTNDIGKYNVANTIGNVFQAIATASGMAVGPIMNEVFKKQEDEKAKYLVFLLQIIFWLLTFIVCIWLKEIFYALIKNEALANTYPLAVLIIMSYNYRPMYFGANNKLFYLEKTQVLWKISFIAGLTNVLLNLILIPFFGYEIAALNTFISFMYMGYSGFTLKIQSEIKNANYFPIWWLIGTILITALAYYLVNQSIVIKIALSIISIIVVFPFVLSINHKLSLNYEER